jgi:hypothetical protein
MTSKYGLSPTEEAAIDYREAEKAAYNADRKDGSSAVERAVTEHIAQDPEIEGRTKKVLNDIYLELHHRRIEQKDVKNFEAHHENEVAREALMIAVAETGDPEASGDAVRRRMLLTATAEEFYEITTEKDEEPTGP